MSKEVLVTIVLMIIQLPLNFLVGNMAQVRSRVSTIVSAAASVSILCLLLLYWADKISQNYTLYGAIGVTIVMILIVVIVALTKKPTTEAVQAISAELVHFEKMRDAIIDLQTLPIEKRVDALNIIQTERTYLSDSELQNELDLFINGVNEATRYGMDITQLMINPIISRITRRVHKGFKR